ncbi:PREDICTED: potassium/sodium hyperpolarization-activated cyclic nucleotide-gated channel 2-like [Eufriesea mexicana]|uniref:potassium/sodium hyperpolarization-activated cyclic nucleotide-gated channel 2-like n=1 Tax=Eufriesea mexicana TaxID=516756 RepID=UPI00083BF6EB|nr:PREDICTED: potassium/sodium hyperpolarization-activated cyclic nucleotide-gated channel 2-like [Eufriesea mexicana]
MILHVDHTCEIPADNDDILFLPGRGPIRRVYDILRLSLLASRKNPAAHKYLRSNASIVQEKRRHWRSYSHIIHPFSLFRHCWDILMIFVITSLLMLVPYQATFEMGKKSKIWNISKNFLLLICCGDIMVNLMTGYFDKEIHATVLEQRKIINRYMKSGTFFVDVLGSFPTDVLYLSMWIDYMVLRKATSLMCIFRVFSLSSYIGKLAVAYDVPLALQEFCLILFWMIMLVHWQSCIHWLIPLVTTSLRQPQRPSKNSWIEKINLWDAPRSQQYLASSLRAITTFTRAGLLYTNQEDAGDIFLMIALQLCGIVAPWFLITRVMQFFKGVNSSRLKYQGTVAQLKQYMRHKQLPYPTQRRIIQYYEFRFQHRFFRESEIINTLSSQMRQEIRMHSCRKLVENVTFFNNLPLSLLGRIVALLKSEIFLTNDVIVRANQAGDCMYFIATGTVAIYTNSGKEVCHLEDGAHFGEVALVMPNEMRVASVVAVETCELYRLNRADFARTIHPYPMLWERIKKIAIERHEKTMILNEQ